MAAYDDSVRQRSRLAHKTYLHDIEQDPTDESPASTPAMSHASDQHDPVASTGVLVHALSPPESAGPPASPALSSVPCSDAKELYPSHSVAFTEDSVVLQLLRKQRKHNRQEYPCKMVTGPDR